MFFEIVHPRNICLSPDTLVIIILLSFGMYAGMKRRNSEMVDVVGTGNELLCKVRRALKKQSWNEILNSEWLS